MVKISYKVLDEETSNAPSVKSFRSNRLKGNVIGVQRENLFFLSGRAMQFDLLAENVNVTCAQVPPIWFDGNQRACYDPPTS